MKITENDFHGINNALTVIMGNSDYMLELKTYDIGSCKAIKLGSERIIEIIKRIKRGDNE